MATVKEILHTDLRTIRTNRTLAYAARVFAGEVLGLLVCVEQDRMAGVLSERDVVRSLGEGDDPEQTHVFDAMTMDVVTVDVSTELSKAVELMLKDEIRHLVVTEHDAPYGIISARDLLRAHLAAT